MEYRQPWPVPGLNNREKGGTMFNLESINNRIRETIEKIGEGEKEKIKVLRQERIAQEIFLFQLNNAKNIIKWNYLCLKYALSEKDPLGSFGESFPKQDLEQMKEQTKELSGLINELCELLNMSRSEMENELNLLIRFE